MHYTEPSPDRYQATPSPLIQNLINNVRSLTTIPDFLMTQIPETSPQDPLVQVICDDMDVVARKIRRYLDYVMNQKVPTKTVEQMEGNVALLEEGVSLWTRTVRKGALNRNVTRADVGLGRALVGVVEGVVGFFEIGDEAMRDKRYLDGRGYVWEKVQSLDMAPVPPKTKDIKLNTVNGDVMYQRWRLACRERHWFQGLDFNELPTSASSMRHVPSPSLRDCSHTEKTSHLYGSSEIPCLLSTWIDTMLLRICLPENSPAILQMIDVDPSGLKRDGGGPGTAGQQG